MNNVIFMKNIKQDTELQFFLHYFLTSYLWRFIHNITTHISQKMVKKRTTWFYDDICNNNRYYHNTVDEKYISFNRNAEYSRLVAKMPRIRSQNDGGLIEPRPKKEKIGTSRVRLFFINISFFFFLNHLVIFSLFLVLFWYCLTLSQEQGEGNPRERWLPSDGMRVRDRDSYLCL